MQNLIVLYATNPPKAKVESIRRSIEAEGKNLVLLPMNFKDCEASATAACLEWDREMKLMKKALKSKTSRFFTEAEREYLKVQINELDLKIQAVLSNVTFK